MQKLRQRNISINYFSNEHNHFCYYSVGFRSRLPCSLTFVYQNYNENIMSSSAKKVKRQEEKEVLSSVTFDMDDRVSDSSFTTITVHFHLDLNSLLINGDNPYFNCCSHHTIVKIIVVEETEKLYFSD